MDLMISIYDNHLAPAHTSDGKGDPQVESMMELVRDQRVKLAREVERWCKERGV